MGSLVGKICLNGMYWFTIHLHFVGLEKELFV